MNPMKISLYHDGAVGFDGLLFESIDAAESTLRRLAPTRAMVTAFEPPHDYDRMGKLICTVRRLRQGQGHDAFDAAVDADLEAKVDPRPAVAPSGRLKRLTFWGADDNDDTLVRSVVAGHKTVTADTVEDYHKPYGPFGDGSYAAGDLIEVYDLRQRLRCTIRATKVYNIRFGDIPQEVWRGETFDSADQFRQVHIDALPHLDLHDGFEFVTLHFALVDVFDDATPSGLEQSP